MGRQPGLPTAAERLEKGDCVLAFIHIPKTAGSTISTILRHSYCWRHCDIRLGDDLCVPPLTAAVLRRTRWIYWRLESVAGHGIVPYSDLGTTCPDIRYYTFVREPIVRCASEYQFLVQRDGLSDSFDQWIESDRARNRMTRTICGEPDASKAIAVVNGWIGFVGLVERFDQSLVLLRQWLGRPVLDIRYRSKNVMRDSSIKDRLLGNEASRKKLAAANQQDIELYRYVTEHIYPEQVRRYGSGLAADVRHFVATNRRPRPYPRQLASLLVREMIYKPLARTLARTGAVSDLGVRA